MSKKPLDFHLKFNVYLGKYKAQFRLSRNFLLEINLMLLQKCLEYAQVASIFRGRGSLSLLLSYPFCFHFRVLGNLGSSIIIFGNFPDTCIGPRATGGGTGAANL